MHLLGAGRAAVPDELLRATVGLLEATLSHRLQALIAGVLSAMIFEKMKTFGMVGVAGLSLVSTVTFLVAFQPPAARLGAEAAPNSGQFQSSLPQDATQKAFGKAAGQLCAEPDKDALAVQPNADEKSVAHVMGELRGELELLELESTIYRDAFKSTKDAVVGADIESFEKEASDPVFRILRRERRPKTALLSMRASSPLSRSSRRSTCKRDAQIAVLKSKMAREPGSGSTRDKDEPREPGTARGPGDHDAVQFVGKSRGELELLEVESDHYRAAIKQSLSLLDVLGDDRDVDSSGLDPVAKEKANRVKDANRRRGMAQKKLDMLKKNYINAREQIALLEAKIASESLVRGRFLDDDETGDAQTEIGRRLSGWRKRLTRFRRVWLGFAIDELSAAGRG